MILPPDDTPGGAALGAVEYVERLLTAFDADPPALYAGGPYSGRQPFSDGNGAPSANLPANDFATFLPLDRVALAAWRLQIYGSTGVSGGGPNDAVTEDQVAGAGPIVGLRDQVRAILGRAMSSAAPKSIESLDPVAAAALFANLDPDDRNQLALLVTEAAFAAPEYGGNPGLQGWKMVHFEGDSQPLGYSIFDESAGVYRERADAPMSTANPGTDPEPLDDDVRALLTTVTNAAGGKVFP